VLAEIDHEVAHAVVAAALERAEDLWLTARETRSLLEAYGVPLVAEGIAETVEEAVAAAEGLGYPVAVKTALPGVHKTEIAGVELSLESPAAVRQAAERIGPPLLVQPMVLGGAEVLAGLVQDPLFGPLVAFGPGGRLAELIGEAGFRIAPLTDVDAAELVREGKAGRLVAGFRGAPPADEGALIDLLHRLSRIGYDLPQVAELDLNPVIALFDRCVAVDARARVRRLAPPEVVKTW
jgi:acyl-CoA synthetase (NDP forming)